MKQAGDSTQEPVPLLAPRALSWLLAVSVAALLLRVLPFVRRVFTPAGIQLYGDTDPHYHVRRIEAVADVFPRVPDFDAWMAHPDGAYCIWAPLFDFVPGAFAFMTGIDAKTVAVLWPPLLGALGVAALFVFAHTAFGLVAAVVASLLYAVLPAVLLSGAVGHVDHHVAELLFQIVIHDRIARDLTGLVASRPSPAVRPARGLLLGVLMGAALMTWSGSVIFLVLPAAALCLGVLREREHGRALARYGLIAFGVAASIALPYGLLNLARGRHSMSPNFPSLLQPSLCLVLAVAPFALCLVLEAARTSGWKGAARRSALLLLVPALALCIPSLRAGLASGLGFLGRTQSDWLQQISEFRPLFYSVPVLEGAMHGVGYAFFLLPLAAAATLLVELRRAAPRWHLLVLALWALHTFTLGVLQLRFVEYAAAPIALLPFWLRDLAGSMRSVRALHPRALLVPVALPVLLSYPTLELYAPWARGRDLPFPQLGLPAALFFDAVRKVTPSAGDSSKLDARPSYGVLAPWDLGHWILVRSQRAVVANNFGDHLTGGGYEDSERFFYGMLEEPEALALIERRRCRYAISYGDMEAELRARKRWSFIHRLHATDGADGPHGPGTGRFRLVLESRGPKIAGTAPYKLYELVKGAELSVPGAALAGDVPLRVSSRVRVGSRRFPYLRELERAPGSDRRVVRLSYPGKYTLRAGAHVVAELSIDEQAVLDGKKLTLKPRPRPNTASAQPASTQVNAPATTDSEPAR